MSVQMELFRIIISEMNDQQIIMLKEVDGERSFSIVIGNPEGGRHRPPAQGTRRAAAAYARPARERDRAVGRGDRPDRDQRPAGRHLFLPHPHPAERERAEGRLPPPSDAIALGVATTVPIFVAEHVLAEATRG
jgi:hypothetical protein